MIVFRLFELAFILAALGTGVTQVVIPLIRNHPVFPFFRPRHPEVVRQRMLARQRTAARHELKAAQARKEAAEMKSQAALIDSDADRLELEALDTRMQPLDERISGTEVKQAQRVAGKTQSTKS